MEAVLFIGWGEPVRQREVEAVKAFEDAQAYWAELQELGEIGSFETVLLTPHGGSLKGFTVLRGTEEQLFKLQTKDEFLALQNRVRLIVDDLGIRHRSDRREHDSAHEALRRADCGHPRLTTARRRFSPHEHGGPPRRASPYGHGGPGPRP